jgi:hypothetical protein
VKRKYRRQEEEEEERWGEAWEQGYDRLVDWRSD